MLKSDICVCVFVLLLQSRSSLPKLKRTFSRSGRTLHRLVYMLVFNCPSYKRTNKKEISEAFTCVYMCPLPFYSYVNYHHL